MEINYKEKKKIINKIVKEEYSCLHFDGKAEIQVVTFQNENNKINLRNVKCESGKSHDIFEALKKLLNDFDAWKCVTIIM